MMADLTTKYMEDADLGLGCGWRGGLGPEDKKDGVRRFGGLLRSRTAKPSYPSNRQTVELYCSTTIRYLLASQNLSGAAIAISPFNCPFFWTTRIQVGQVLSSHDPVLPVGPGQGICRVLVRSIDVNSCNGSSALARHRGCRTAGTSLWPSSTRTPLARSSARVPMT